MAYLSAVLAGLAVGAAYVLMGTRSPAPPPLALCGLLGLLAGQTLLTRL